METLHLGHLELTLGEPDVLFSIADANLPYSRRVVTPPRFEVDARTRDRFAFRGYGPRRDLLHGGQEHILHYSTDDGPVLRLDVVIRSFPTSPVLRLRYTLTADTPVPMTKTGGQDAIRYLTMFGWQSDSAMLAQQGQATGRPSSAYSRRSDSLVLTQHQLSHFDPVAHSYMPGETRNAVEVLYHGQQFSGPIAAVSDGPLQVLLAYEHGADHPDGFLRFAVQREPFLALELSAAKGNYHHGQVVDTVRPFTSVWFEIGISRTDSAGMLRRYRQFFLDEIAENVESRKPYLYYNTWNHQERRKYFDRAPYLTDMHFARMSREIDAAHELGIDVFVIDTGWYGKTGDWLVNRERFPDGLKEIKRKLDQYGMKLGLWFNPIVAAKTSKIYIEHPEYVMSSNGERNFWGEIWETEASYGMCLASGYADHFIETLVRLNGELGVTYFKWDALGQYGCDSPHHNHGGPTNSREERSDCYAFESGRSMIRIVEEVSRQCPDVIVDFDITEGGRFVGLGFLSVGKYFLINNGPYFHDFDIPDSTKIDPNTINVFFYPGPARPRICRQGAKYDSIIPSILFLTHYLPDAPALSQRNSLAALMLGGNGIWGDLVGLEPEDIALLSGHLHDYKRVSAAVTRAYPRVTGFAGSSPEIHEKLDPVTASGLVVFFTVKGAQITYVTQPIALDQLQQVKGADAWERLPDGRVKLTITLQQNDALPVYFFGA